MGQLTNKLTQQITQGGYSGLLPEVKEYLRITHAFEDSILGLLIKTAALHLERVLGVKLVHQTLVTWFESFNDASPWWDGVVTAPNVIIRNVDLTLPFAPVSSVESVKYYTDNDDELIVPATDYRVANQDKHNWSKVRLVEGATWPTDLRNINSLSVEYIAGFAADLGSLPEDLQLAVIMFAAYLYQNRGCGCSGGYEKSGVADYVGKYRMMHI